MTKAKSIIIPILVNVTAFYLLPLIGSSYSYITTQLLFITPVICFFAALAYSIKCGFSIIVPVLCSVLFIPAIYLYYNRSAWIFVAGFFLVSLIGSLTGNVINKRSNVK